MPPPTPTIVPYVPATRPSKTNAAAENGVIGARTARRREKNSACESEPRHNADAYRRCGPCRPRRAHPARRRVQAAPDILVRAGHHVYLVRCADGSYYCGYALDPTKRVQVHNAGKGSKILRGRLPVRLSYVRRFASKGDALRFERALKCFSHDQKRQLSLQWRVRTRR
ncbi:MAG: GIY-YIG nuclease family protein [Candidatus Eremiobacteraeota bacterium]|nr:GIY-YIG nuclease family protein [Candidatus Eremiobacteraeota bacterium]